MTGQRVTLVTPLAQVLSAVDRTDDVEARAAVCGTERSTHAATRGQSSKWHPRGSERPRLEDTIRVFALRQANSFIGGQVRSNNRIVHEPIRIYGNSALDLPRFYTRLRKLLLLPRVNSTSIVAPTYISMKGKHSGTTRETRLVINFNIILAFIVVTCTQKLLLLLTIQFVVTIIGTVQQATRLLCL